MLLALDIGNSNVTIGLYEGGRWQQLWRLPTRSDLEALLFYEVQLSNLLLEADIAPGDVRTFVMSSVVPDLIPVFEQVAEQIFQLTALTLYPTLYPGIQIQIDRPSEIGTDLVANAIAAHHLYGQDCIIVDFGTALTFTTVTSAGHVLGVAIAPGLKTAISSLFQKTAQLPEVPLRLPDSAVGKNTVRSIQSGILLGYVGLVRELLRQIRSELGQHYIAVATGGLSSILHPLRRDFTHVNMELTLEGLRLVGEAPADSEP